MCDIAIKAASSLPKTIMPLSVWLLVRQSGKEFWRSDVKIGQCSSGYGKLDRATKLADVEIDLSRPDQEVNMFGHDHISPDMKRLFLPGAIDRFNQPGSAAILAKKLLPLEAGERESVRLTWIVELLGSFPMAHKTTALRKNTD